MGVFFYVPVWGAWALGPRPAPCLLFSVFQNARPPATPRRLGPPQTQRSKTLGPALQVLRYRPSAPRHNLHLASFSPVSPRSLPVSPRIISPCLSASPRICPRIFPYLVSPGISLSCPWTSRDAEGLHGSGESVGTRLSARRRARHLSRLLVDVHMPINIL